jgi:hypothetical protein
MHTIDAIRARSERERVKRVSSESETAESSQSASPAFSSQELLTSKQHTRKLGGVGERIIGPEQALELIELTVSIKDDFENLKTVCKCVLFS